MVPTKALFLEHKVHEVTRRGLLKSGITFFVNFVYFVLN